MKSDRGRLGLAVGGSGEFAKIVLSAIISFMRYFNELLERDEAFTIHNRVNLEHLHYMLSYAMRPPGALPFAPLVSDGILAGLTVIDNLLRRNGTMQDARSLLELERQKLWALLDMGIKQQETKSPHLLSHPVWIGPNITSDVIPHGHVLIPTCTSGSSKRGCPTCCSNALSRPTAGCICRDGQSPKTASPGPVKRF